MDKDSEKGKWCYYIFLNPIFFLMSLSTINIRMTVSFLFKKTKLPIFCNKGSSGKMWIYIPDFGYGESNGKGVPFWAMYIMMMPFHKIRIKSSFFSIEERKTMFKLDNYTYIAYTSDDGGTWILEDRNVSANLAMEYIKDAFVSTGRFFTKGKIF